MNFSNNYKFNLPSRDGEDIVDINLISENFETIDAALFGVAQENSQQSLQISTVEKNVTTNSEHIETNRTGLITLKQQINTNGNEIEALKEQIDNLPKNDVKSELFVRNNSINFFDNVEDFEKTENGVQFAWSKSEQQLVVFANEIAGSVYCEFYSLTMSDLPEGIDINDILTLNISGVNDAIKLHVVFNYNDETTSKTTTYGENGSYDIELAENISNINFRFRVASGTYENDTVINLTLQNAPSNKELEAKLNANSTLLENVRKKAITNSSSIATMRVEISDLQYDVQFMKVVETLPTENIFEHTIYFVPKTEPQENNRYDKFVYLNVGTADAPEYIWEKL